MDTKGLLIDNESHKIKRTVFSTTVAELYAFMKCYSPAQFYRGLWMDMTAELNRSKFIFAQMRTIS